MGTFTRRRKVVAATIVALLAFAGAAFAYWTTTGSGTGSATTGTSTAVTVAQTGTITALAPGSGSQPVDFTVTNPKGTAQYLHSVTFAISSITKVSDGSPATGCSTVGGVDFTLVQPTAINADLPTGDTPYSPSNGSIAMNDTTSNQDACQNVTIHLAFTANAS